jgi:drug/metabolite transporter (DMT)-like permease
MLDLFESLINPFRGELAALSTALFWAFAAILYKRVGKYIPAAELNLVKGLLGIGMICVTLVLRGSSFLPTHMPAFWLFMGSGALGIGIGDTAFFQTLNYLGARRTLLLSILTPPVTALLALLFLHEMLSLYAWCGVFITVIGVAWVVSERTPGGNEERRMTWLGIGCGLVAIFTQAGGIILSRAAFLHAPVEPLPSTLYRMVGGVLIVLIWLPLVRQTVGGWLRDPGSKRIWRTVLAATFIGTYLGLWFQQIAVKYTSAGVAQTLFATSPLFVLPMVAFLGERVTIRAVLGAFVALGGVALLFLFKV